MWVMQINPRNASASEWMVSEVQKYIVAVSFNDAKKTFTPTCRPPHYRGSRLTWDHAIDVATSRYLPIARLDRMPGPRHWNMQVHDPPSRQTMRFQILQYQRVFAARYSPFLTSRRDKYVLSRYSSDASVLHGRRLTLQAQLGYFSLL